MRLLNFNKKEEPNDNTNNKQETYNQYLQTRQELRENFGEYNIGSSDGFLFIHRHLKDLQKTLIISSLIKEGDIPLDVVKDVYGLTDEYIDGVIDEEFPIIRAEAYRYLKNVAPKIKYAFFPDVETHEVAKFKELTDRMELISELRKNAKKIKKEFGNSILSNILQNNISLLEFLNHFDVKDSLNIVSNLGLLNSLEDELIQGIYNFEENEFKELLDSKRMKYVESNLKEKINKFGHIEISLDDIYLDYDALIENYNDILERINQTKEYVFSRNSSKQLEKNKLIY